MLLWDMSYPYSCVKLIKFDNERKQWDMFAMDIKHFVIGLDSKWFVYIKILFL